MKNETSESRFCLTIFVEDSPNLIVNKLYWILPFSNTISIWYDYLLKLRWIITTHGLQVLKPQHHNTNWKLY